MTLGPITRVRLEKAASDTGFDLDRGADGPWLCFESSHANLRLWLGEWPGGLLLAAFSHPGLLHTLGDRGVPLTGPLPLGAVGGRGVPDFGALHALLDRALRLAQTLPDALLQAFAEQTAALPRATEAERQVVQRVGQDLFRRGLLDLWGGRCAITGLAQPALLRASHARPWKDCPTDAMRLDVYNGLLLAAHLDAAFDAGLLTVLDDGRVRLAPALDADAQALLGLDRPLRVRGLAPAHRPYLAWHRERVFVGGEALQVTPP